MMGRIRAECRSAIEIEIPDPSRSPPRKSLCRRRLRSRGGDESHHQTMVESDSFWCRLCARVPNILSKRELERINSEEAS